MQEILELLKAANDLSPLGIIALLVVVVFMLVKGRKEVATKVKDLSDNHLHDLPILVANSVRTVDVLQRIEVKLGENFAALHEKLDEARK